MTPLNPRGVKNNNGSSLKMPSSQHLSSLGGSAGGSRAPSRAPASSSSIRSSGKAAAVEADTMELTVGRSCGSPWSPISYFD